MKAGRWNPEAEDAQKALVDAFKKEHNMKRSCCRPELLAAGIFPPLRFHNIPLRHPHSGSIEATLPGGLTHAKIYTLLNLSTSHKDVEMTRNLE